MNPQILRSREKSQAVGVLIGAVVCECTRCCCESVNDRH